MSKLVQRLLVFFIGIPVVMFIVCFDMYNHLLLHLVLLVCSIIATCELYKLFNKKTSLLPKILLCILSSLFIVISYFSFIFKFSAEYLCFYFIVAILLILAIEVFSHKTFEESNIRIASSVFIIFYSGYLLSFISKITSLENSSIVLSVFLFTIFICDSLAWLIGMLFGKGNRGIIAASPNKSVAGFIGGYIGAVASTSLAYFLMPYIFNDSIIKAILTGILIATTGIIGDLVESVFKRSSESKDSGDIILGRGGLLDSIDSIIYSAPIFFIFFKCFN